MARDQIAGDQEEFNPSDHFEPSLIDCIQYFADLAADERDRRLREDIRKAGVNIPEPTEDDD